MAGVDPFTVAYWHDDRIGAVVPLDSALRRRVERVGFYARGYEFADSAAVLGAVLVEEEPVPILDVDEEAMEWVLEGYLEASEARMARIPPYGGVYTPMPRG